MSDTKPLREWLNITTEKYHALDAFGSSSLRRFVLDPLKFWTMDIAKTEAFEESDSMRLGTDFHLARQSGDEWRGWRVIPAVVQSDDLMELVNSTVKGNTKKLEAGAPIDAALAAHKSYLKAHRDKAVADAVQCIDGRVAPMVAACFDNPAVAELMAAKPELTGEAACLMHHPTGVELKALCDLVLPTGIVDYKTTRHRTAYDFLRDAHKRGYQWQAALYSLVTGKKQFWIASVTNTPPHVAMVYEVPSRLLAELQEKTVGHVEQIAQFLRMREFDEKNFEGVPRSFMPEGWGTTLTFDERGPYEEDYDGSL